MERETDARRAVRARSFGTIAEEYDRFRPGPSEEVVDWLVPAGAGTVVDLGAGTGALTVLLAARFGRVVAVEPDDRMRAVLAGKRLGGVEVVEGSAEAVPLPDRSADAVAVSSAWHWMDPERAVAEIARVLEPGGRLGVVWSGIDRAAIGLEHGSTVSLQADFGLGAQAERQPAAGDPGGGSRHELVLPPGAPFSEPEEKVISWARPMSVDDLVGNVGTYSRIIILPEGEQAGIADKVRSYLEERYGVVGGETIDVPFLARCWRTERR